MGPFWGLNSAGWLAFSSRRSSESLSYSFPAPVVVLLCFPFPLRLLQFPISHGFTVLLLFRLPSSSFSHQPPFLSRPPFPKYKVPDRLVSRQSCVTSMVSPPCPTSDPGAPLLPLCRRSSRAKSLTGICVSFCGNMFQTRRKMPPFPFSMVVVRPRGECLQRAVRISKKPFRSRSLPSVFTRVSARQPSLEGELRASVFWGNDSCVAACHKGTHVS